eukprot:TRINITY_DN1610_c0_g1_i1.p1 TRINITY_DN1610_c0_g1~~TRINITY_DN1610_c0_g1_i1.p1  ORF type:complete len:613 (-),score=90.68 TRINITY_DN1610_c0_g1_i1:50-1858(-)
MWRTQLQQQALTLSCRRPLPLLLCTSTRPRTLQGAPHLVPPPHTHLALRTASSYSASTGFARPRLPETENEALKDYAPGSKDAKLLQEACGKLRAQPVPEIPCVVGGKEIRTGNIQEQVMPSDHKKVLCRFHQASKEVLEEAVESSMQAKAKWEALPFEDRAAVFLRAANLLSTKYRSTINAATMLGQGKTVWQAEIDAAAETIDFLRFNVKFAESLYENQPPRNSPAVWNRSEYRPLEGYVVAISPFNFTAIGANLPSAPATMGNVVLWKPASTALYSNWVFFNVLREAGLPDGVIQFVPGAGRLVGDTLLNSPKFAGLHFTGSTATFNSIMYKSAQNLASGLYKHYPRMVGETGGKDFHFIHESADLTNAVLNTLRAAFEYQGQKCSACSRIYIPDTMWPKFRDLFFAELQKIKIGQPDDFSNFMTAVIDKNSFQNIKGYIDHARTSPDAEIVYGGKCDDSTGFFIEPTVILAKKPDYKSMQEEIFGPVLTVYVYPANQYEETLELCDKTSPYALTGAIFANDRYAVDTAQRYLKNAAGNFYINDKCTGAVVGQQPFGGSRASGTNDKAGSALNLLRWVNMRTVKENFVPLTQWQYAHHL